MTTAIDARLHGVAVLARLLITRGWCQGDLAQDSRGRSIATGDDRAYRLSLTGALKCAATRLHGSDWAMVVRAARRALEPACGRDLSAWDDRPTRTRDDVLTALGEL